MEEIFNQIATDIKEQLFHANSPLAVAAYRWIMRQCRDNRYVEVDIVDFGYDVSDSPRRTAASINFSLLSTVQDFLDLYTGNTVATYCSGYGLRAETYEDRFEEFVRDYLSEWVYAHQLSNKIKGSDGNIVFEMFEYLCDNDCNEYDFINLFNQSPFPRIREV